MLARTCGGRGLSDVNGPPGAEYINMKDKIIRINSVGIDTANLRIIK